MRPFCLVESCALDAAALCRWALCLPHAHYVPSSSVVRWHWKRDYTLYPFTVRVACYNQPVLLLKFSIYFRFLINLFCSWKVEDILCRTRWEVHGNGARLLRLGRSSRRCSINNSSNSKFNSCKKLSTDQKKVNNFFIGGKIKKEKSPL